MFNPIRVFMQFAMPKSEYSHAVRHHESVLRSVVLHSFLLSRIKVRVFGRIAVPVVPIELNDHVMVRQIGVNTKPSVNHVLSTETQTEVIEHSVSETLTRGQLERLLHVVHAQELSRLCGVGISARYGAIPNVVRFFAGRRPPERDGARLAHVRRFVSALKFVCADLGTQIIHSHRAQCPVERRIALSALYLNTASSQLRSGRTRARLRAIAARRLVPARFDLTAPTTSNSANRVHSRHFIPINS
jgi:hypothetical protein